MQELFAGRSIMPKSNSESMERTKQSTRAVNNGDSTNPGGLSIVPPAYGLSIVDQGFIATPVFAGEQAQRGIYQLQPEEEQPAAIVSRRHASESRPTANRTGLPGPLKARLEQLSGLDLSAVHVNYNSAKPARLGAVAFTQGQHIEIGPGQERHLPHEGWHVVQQMQGRVKPRLRIDGVALNTDRALEQEADVMAAKVGSRKRPFSFAQAHSASAPGHTTPRRVENPFVVQRMGERLGDEEQKRYTLDQYIQLWERERGRTLTPQERRTLERGCIGLTAVNLGCNDPPLDEVYDNFNTAMVKIMERNIAQRDIEALTGKRPRGRWVMFAKLFWSEQVNIAAALLGRGNPEAFRGNERTRRVDMSNYKFQGNGDTIKFDYGFWDEDSQTWWHANHQHESNSPMIVLQSGAFWFDRLIESGGEIRYGYSNFDRVVYGVAFARTDYDARLAAQANAGRYGI